LAAALHDDSRIYQSLTLPSPRWRFVPIVLMLLAVSASPRLGAQNASGADVKAAFLFNFAKFVDWPAAALPAGQPLVVGVLGSNEIADSLARVAAGKLVGGHTIQVKRLVITDDPTTVQVLFIDNSERARANEFVRRIGNSSVLSVSDVPRFLDSGGVIQLRTQDDRVRFDVDLQRAQDSRLVINSKLLALAAIVNPAKAN
jgi:hypothetical protein